MRRRNEWWAFSRSEIIGILGLSILVVLSIALKPLSDTFIHQWSDADTLGFYSLIKEIESLDAKKEKVSNDFEQAERPLVGHGFPFDPNKIDLDSLELFGFSPTMAERFVKYRRSIGQFETKDQVLALYGLKPPLAQRIDSFIEIGETANVSDIPSTRKDQWFGNKADSNPSKTIRSYPRLQIELNSADTTQLKKIYGIGSWRASRILKFRSALGGFTRIDQLFEVYGLDTASLDLDRVEFLLDTSLVQRIRINHVDGDQLSMHPYISSKQARVLIRYRDSHGSFNKIDDLLLTKVFDSEELEQLAGYLDFE